MEQLLVAMEAGDGDRPRLEAAMHEATGRAKDTHESLKEALAPLTFAYGEEDGQAMYEAVVNDPEKYVGK